MTRRNLSIKLQVFHWPTAHGKVPQNGDDSWGRLLCTRVSRMFFPCRKETRGLLEKMVEVSETISVLKSTFFIHHHFTCTFSHLIYCISCSRCCMLYIGETGRLLRTRIGEYLRAVCANNTSQSVARHFNSGSHIVSYMKIRTLCPISELATLQPSGLNEVFLTFSITWFWLRFSPSCILLLLLIFCFSVHIFVIYIL